MRDPAPPLPSHRSALRRLFRPLARRYRNLPTARKMVWRRLFYAPAETIDRWRGRADPLLPPRWLRYVGAGDFRDVGEEFLNHCIRLAGLRPDEDVLDVGCGVGRMAVPLTGHLSPEARYDGFDIVPAAVEWCGRHISPRFPNFHFHLADLRNRRYHPDGDLPPRDFRFPFENATFDFALATSVFTHMAWDDVTHYLAEIARVLRPGGRCLATFFLIDHHAREALARSATALPFTVEPDGTWTVLPGDPEHLAAFDPSRLRDACGAAGLDGDWSLYPGTWCGRTEGTSYQDIVVMHRQVQIASGLHQAE